MSQSDIHPAPTEFNESEIGLDPILRYFHYYHLPERLKGTSMIFCRAAREVVDTVPRTAERTVALRKLLEAKDCAVRSHVN